jgi:hypothetical protein
MPCPYNFAPFAFFAAKSLSGGEPESRFRAGVKAYPSVRPKVC